jgi:hypothetical protein
MGNEGNLYNSAEHLIDFGLKKINKICTDLNQSGSGPNFPIAAEFLAKNIFDIVNDETKLKEFLVNRFIEIKNPENIVLYTYSADTYNKTKRFEKIKLSKEQNT